jgi:iron complex transport system substrate-binding protein
MKKIISIAMALCIILSGCGMFSKSNNSSSSKGSEYPVQIFDSSNSFLKIKSQPKRIISLSSESTTTIFALGMGGNIVGRSDYSTYPQEALSIPSVGTAQNPDVVKILDLKPDLIITLVPLSPQVMSTLKLPVLAINPLNTIDGVKTFIEDMGIATVGNITGKTKADAINESIDTQISDTKKRVEGYNKPTVYYVLGYGKHGDYSATGDTLIAKLIEIAGGENIAIDDKNFAFSLQKLQQANPNIIICPKGSKADFLSIKDYSNLTAVKSGKVYEVDTSAIELISPRIAEGLRALTEIIHPLGETKPSSSQSSSQASSSSSSSSNSSGSSSGSSSNSSSK